MLFLLGRIGFCLAVLTVLGGCVSTVPKAGKSPLAPARMSPDSVVLDIFFVRFPFGDPEVNGPLWHELDEQHIALEQRRRLAGNGLRAGLVGGQLPVTLSRLLELGDKPPSDDQANESVEVGPGAKPTVVRRHLQLRTGRRSEIVTSGVYDELPVLKCESGNVCGEIYPQAQTLLAIKAFPQGDGRVRLELTPELRYGQTRQRWVGKLGMWRLEAGQPRKTLDQLAISPVLAPGQMLVLAGLPNRPGSLGHHFFSETTAGRLEQKLLVVRLTQTQHDDLFPPGRVLPLEQ